MPIILHNVTLSGATLLGAAPAPAPTPPAVATELNSPYTGTVVVSPSGTNIINNIAWYTYFAQSGGGGATNELFLSTNMVAGIYDTSGNFLREYTANDVLLETGSLYMGIATGPVTWGPTNWTTTGGTIPVSPKNVFDIDRIS
jgi:hypothetical protein